MYDYFIINNNMKGGNYMKVAKNKTYTPEQIKEVEGIARLIAVLPEKKREAAVVIMTAYAEGLTIGFKTAGE